ncbi:hypothetical protein N8464_00925, partial [bacterium]|nr:hypothetical protein [bacterium]
FTVEGSLHQEIQDMGDNASPEKQQAFIDKHLVHKQELPDGYTEAEVLDLSANRLGDLDKDQLEDVYESVQEGTVSEAEMTDAQKEKREVIVKGLKKKMSEFKDRYGDKATDVMYATATKMAMKDDEEDEELEEGYYSEGVIADLEKIVKTKSAGQVKFKDGKKQKIDLFSASAVLNAYKSLNSVNKKKVESMLSDKKQFTRFVSFAMQAA